MYGNSVHVTPTQRAGLADTIRLGAAKQATIRSSTVRSDYAQRAAAVRAPSERAGAGLSWSDLNARKLQQRRAELLPGAADGTAPYDGTAVANAARTQGAANPLIETKKAVISGALQDLYYNSLNDDPRAVVQDMSGLEKLIRSSVLSGDITLQSIQELAKDWETLSNAQGLTTNFPERAGAIDSAFDDAIRYLGEGTHASASKLQTVAPQLLQIAQRGRQFQTPATIAAAAAAAAAAAGGPPGSAAAGTGGPGSPVRRRINFLSSP